MTAHTQVEEPPEVPVALVTGGGSGIGAATAAALLAVGARVAIADLDPARVSATARSLDAAFPGRAHAVNADITTAQGADTAIGQTIDAFGGLDLLHLNAGRPGLGPVTADTDIAAAQDVIVTNVMAVIAPFVTALPQLARSPRAAVTVTASLAGLVGSPADPLYAASKHALVGLVRSLAPAQSGLRINAICPSLVATPMLGHDSDGIDQLPVLAAEEVAGLAVEQLLGDADGQIVFLEADRGRRVVAEPVLSALQHP